MPKCHTFPVQKLRFANAFQWRRLLNPGGYLTFTTGGKIWKRAGHIDPQTVYVDMYTIKNSRQNESYRGIFFAVHFKLTNIAKQSM